MITKSKEHMSSQETLSLSASLRVEHELMHVEF